MARLDILVFLEWEGKRGDGERGEEGGQRGGGGGGGGE